MRQRRTLTSDRPDNPTRQKLIEATAHQIQSVGFERVDVDAVLAEVGATKGALYHHFGSLNGLLVAGLLHAFEQGIEESGAWAVSLREDSRSALDARDRLREILAQSQMPERGPLRSLRLHALSLVRTEPALAGSIASRQAALNAAGADTFRELQSRGWIRADVDPHALAVLIQSMTLGRIVDDVVDERDRMDIGAWRALSEKIFDSFFDVN